MNAKLYNLGSRHRELLKKIAQAVEDTGSDCFMPLFENDCEDGITFEGNGTTVRVACDYEEYQRLASVGAISISGSEPRYFKGDVLPEALEAVRRDFAVPTVSPAAGPSGMTPYDLRIKHRTLVGQLAHWADKCQSEDFAEPVGHSGEPGVVFTNFMGQQSLVPCTRDDLSELARHGAIEFTSQNSMHWAGRVLPAGLDAARNEFRRPVAGGQTVNNVHNAAPSQQVFGPHGQATMNVAGAGDERRLIADLAGITSELCDVLLQILPADQAADVAADAEAVKAEAGKASPDKVGVVTRAGNLIAKGLKGLTLLNAAAGGAEKIEHAAKPLHDVLARALELLRHK